MPQIGNDPNPVRISPNRTVRINGRYIKNENRKKYEDNYDRIFRKKENTNGSR